MRGTVGHWQSSETGQRAGAHVDGRHHRPPRLPRPRRHRHHARRAARPLNREYPRTGRRLRTVTDRRPHPHAPRFEIQQSAIARSAAHIWRRPNSSSCPSRSVRTDFGTAAMLSNDTHDADGPTSAHRTVDARSHVNMAPSVCPTGQRRFRASGRPGRASGYRWPTGAGALPGRGPGLSRAGAGPCARRRPPPTSRRRLGGPW